MPVFSELWTTDKDNKISEFWITIYICHEKSLTKNTEILHNDRHMQLYSDRESKI